MRSSFCWAVWSSLGSQTAQCRVFPSVKHPGTAEPRPWAVRASPCAPQLRLGPWQWPHKGGAAPSSVLAGHSRCRGGAAGSVAGSRSPGLAAGQPSGPAVRGAACAAATGPALPRRLRDHGAGWPAAGCCCFRGVSEPSSAEEEETSRWRMSPGWRQQSTRTSPSLPCEWRRLTSGMFLRGVFLLHFLGPFEAIRWQKNTAKGSAIVFAVPPPVFMCLLCLFCASNGWFRPFWLRTLLAWGFSVEVN